MKKIISIFLAFFLIIVILMNILPGHFEYSCCGVGVFYVKNGARPGCITFCNSNSRPTLMDKIIVFSSTFDLNK